MARKSNAEIEEEKVNKKLLDDLINDIMPTDSDIIDSSNNILPPKPPSEKLNYEDITKKSEEEALDMIESIVIYYIPPDLIEDNYIKHKISMDKITISNLLFQMKTSEHAIKKLLTEIDEGNLHPRMFEVLSGLQRSKMEIIKHLKQVEIIMENNYKTIQIEYEQKQLKSTNSDNEKEDIKQLPGYSTVGTKKLLKDILTEAEEVDEKNIKIS